MRRVVILSAALGSCAPTMPHITLYESEDAVPDSCVRGAPLAYTMPVPAIAEKKEIEGLRARALEDCKNSAVLLGGNAFVLFGLTDRGEADDGTVGMRCEGVVYSCK